MYIKVKHTSFYLKLNKNLIYFEPKFREDLRMFQVIQSE